MHSFPASGFKCLNVLLGPDPRAFAGVVYLAWMTLGCKAESLG